MGRGASGRIATALGVAALLAGYCAIVQGREASAADAGRTSVDIPAIDGGTGADATAEAMAEGGDADGADAGTSAAHGRAQRMFAANVSIGAAEQRVADP